MQDKPGKKLNMNDIVNQYKVDEPQENIIEQQNRKEIERLTSEYNSDEYFQKLKEYNEKFPDWNETYIQVKPLHNVLVRVKVKEPQMTKSGLLKPYKQLVPVPTQNGYGDWAEVESPYPYDTEGIVVAKPDSITSVKVGDSVLLNKNPVEAKVVGKSNEAYLTIPNAFLHPSWKEETPPRDPQSIHYGYLLLPVYEIKCIL